MTDADKLLDEAAFCGFANLKPSTVRKMRITGGGPRFVKIGRLVRYRTGDVLDWIKGRTKANTAAQVPS